MWFRVRGPFRSREEALANVRSMRSNRASPYRDIKLRVRQEKNGYVIESNREAR